MIGNIRAKINANPALQSKLKILGVGGAIFGILYLVASVFNAPPPPKGPAYTLTTDILGARDVSENLKMEGLARRVEELEAERLRGSTEWSKRIVELEEKQKFNDLEKQRLKDEVARAEERARDEMEERLTIIKQQISQEVSNLQIPGAASIDNVAKKSEFVINADEFADNAMKNAPPSKKGYQEDISAKVEGDYEKYFKAYEKDSSSRVVEEANPSPSRKSGTQTVSQPAPAKIKPFSARIISEHSQSSVSGASSDSDSKDAVKSAPIDAKQIASNAALEVSKEEDAKERAKNTIILPAGSILSGIMISGVDAPSGSSAKAQPHPVLIRLKKEAILPNRFRADVKECLVIGSSHGSLSTSRAYIRAERISCITKDRGVIETGVKGYVTGEDGKIGLAGHIVTRQGQLITRSILAGFMSGISSAFAPQEVPVIADSTNGSTVYNKRDVDDILTVSAFNGVSTAAERVADFYLEYAQNIFPTIEIKSGRKIDLILTSGISLKMK